MSNIIAVPSINPILSSKLYGVKVKSADAGSANISDALPLAGTTSRDAVETLDFNVDINDVAELIEEITSRSRRVFTEGNQQTEEFLVQRFRELLGSNAQISLQPISISDSDQTYLEGKFQNMLAIEIHNVIARIPGRDSSRKLVITAHLDSLGEGINGDAAPGANDDASGLAALLEIARILSQMDLPFDVELVAFNGEETRTIGSRSYLATLGENPEQTILGLINLDMLGDDDLGDEMVIASDGISQPLAEIFFEVNSRSQIFPHLEEENVDCFLNGGDECSFRYTQIPIVRIYAPPDRITARHYHTSADIFANPISIARTSELIARAVSRLADSYNEGLSSLQAESWQAQVLRFENISYSSAEQIALNQLRTNRLIDGFDLDFIGEATAIAESPLWDEIAERIGIAGQAAEFSVTITPALSVLKSGIGGVNTPGGISIDLSSAEDVERHRAVIASTLAHEYSHAIQQEYAPCWDALYQEGLRLGTWDLLKDSVLTDYPGIGHPKGYADEGFATAGQAYLIFSQTFLKMIDLLALEEMPEEPFPENESLNRIFKIIWEQTPDRCALRQNLSDIYNYLKENYFFGQEFQSDFI